MKLCIANREVQCLDDNATFDIVDPSPIETHIHPHESVIISSLSCSRDMQIDPPSGVRLIRAAT